MSALAKLYAARGTKVGADGVFERGSTASAISIEAGLPLILRRKIEESRQPMVEAKPSPVEKDAKVTSEAYDYTAALGMLENVNTGFVDVFNRLQKAEALRDHLVAECEKQDRTLQQYQAELEQARSLCEETQNQNAEIAERLIAETSRASELQSRLEQTEHALTDATRRIDEVELVCKTLHDGIYNVFGQGSPTQKVLNSLSKD